MLKKEYKGRLKIIAFLDAIMWLQEEQNASLFITLTDLKYRDRMIEVRLRIELIQAIDVD